MTSVFIGGSRSVSRLNTVIRERLDDLIHRGCLIFIGDANGSDKSVQKYLADRGYQKVIVYCVNKCRNNLGHWQIKQIAVPNSVNGFAYYAAKDLAMAQDASCGFMLWDGKSKGTLNNIQNLLHQGKKILVYLAPRKNFYKISSKNDLHNMLDHCDIHEIHKAQWQIRQKLPNEQQLSLHTSIRK